MGGSYEAEINRAHPGCILFLLDQSRSMKDPIAGDPTTPKDKAAAEAINDLLLNLILQCTLDVGKGPRHYFDVGVIGYGKKLGVGSCLGGALEGRNLVSLPELAANPLRMTERTKQVKDATGALVTQTRRYPIWFEPLAEWGTPMAEAMEFSAKVLKPWVKEHKASFPPIVINITDGEPNSDPTRAAKTLSGLRLDAGNVLLYNLHLSSLATAPIAFPATSAELPDKYSAMLFDISSEIPPPLHGELESEGYPARTGTRGFIFNANGWALLQFLDIGTRVTVEGPDGER